MDHENIQELKKRRHKTMSLLVKHNIESCSAAQNLIELMKEDTSKDNSAMSSLDQHKQNAQLMMLSTISEGLMALTAALYDVTLANADALLVEFDAEEVPEIPPAEDNPEDDFDVFN